MKFASFTLPLPPSTERVKYWSYNEKGHELDKEETISIGLSLTSFYIRGLLALEILVYCF